MCPLNYNRNRKKHKHLTYQERLMIERWINKDNKSNTENGVKASTTHNIYGVYDMSGGAWENVMDNFNYEVGSSGFDTGEILLISSKHLKQYYTSPEDLHDGYGVNYDLTFYGDSVYEVSASAYRHSPVNSIGGTSNSWYYNRSNLPWLPSYPWFARGGYWLNSTTAGVFGFYRSAGHAHWTYSFRPVLSPL